MIKRNGNVSRAARLFLYGCLTGIICGGVISLFLTCAKIVVSFSFGMYEAAKTPLAVVCVIALSLVCCLLVAVVQTLAPSAKGSGIPLAEGCARGILQVKWLRTAAALIAGSLLSFTCGMPLGSEGPSIGVGGLIGEGVGKAAKKPTEFRRYLITGGSSAGLAVAFNAPLTGVAFALEETHRRFSPNILLAAFSAVVPAVLVSQLIFWGLGHDPYLYSIGIRSGAAILPFLAQTPYADMSVFFSVCGVAAICGAITAALAVAFNCSIAVLGKSFSKIKNSALRMLPAFVVSCAVGLALYQTVGSGERTLEAACHGAALWLLFIMLVARFATTAVASGSGATGGLFIPMIAIGGIIGAIAVRACTLCGLPAEYAGNIVMLCISAYFTASVRAPISAIAMALELTASFANILPCAIAVAVATAIAGVARSEPLYERMMKEMQSASTVTAGRKNTVARGVVTCDSIACGKLIRDVLWPYNSLVAELIRGEYDIVPDGETKLSEGDILVIRAELVEPQAFRDELKDYIRLTDDAATGSAADAVTHNRN